VEVNATRIGGEVSKINGSIEILSSKSSVLLGGGGAEGVVVPFPVFTINGCGAGNLGTEKKTVNTLLFHSKKEFSPLSVTCLGAETSKLTDFCRN
jgi:hypothetical protein